MGCCQSTNAAANDEAPAVRPRGDNSQPIPYDSSRAAINQPARPISTVESPRISATSTIPHRNGRPNQLLEHVSGRVAKSPGNEQYPAPWTRSVLQQQRDQFWDTRVTGSRECWDALRAVCDMLRQGNLADAQGIIDAANLTCPNGSVVRYSRRERGRTGVYDERGELYDIPAWVVQDPEDIVDDGVEKDAVIGAVEDDDDDMDNDTEDVENTTAEPQREEKGKGRAADLGDMMTVRARLSDRATDVAVTIGSKQKVATLIRGVQEHISGKRVRLMYMGKVLDERKTILEQGWVQGHVVNALVFEGDESMLGSRSLETRTKGLKMR